MPSNLLDTRAVDVAMVRLLLIHTQSTLSYLTQLVINRSLSREISFDFKVRMMSVVVTEDLSLLTKLATQNLDFLPRGALIEPDRADSSWLGYGMDGIIMRRHIKLMSDKD